MRMRRRGALALALALASTAAPALAEAANETTCWQIDASGALAIAASSSGAACAVEVTLRRVADVYEPNATVPLLWGVGLASDSSNALDVPLPPDEMVTLSADHAGQRVQILATYVRTCAVLDECDPMVTAGATFSTPQSGNFSSAGATYFGSLGGLSFSQDGTYLVSAVAVLGNADNSTLLYYFATFAEINVASQTQENGAVARAYDKTTTYCLETAQGPLDDALDVDALLAQSTSCELQVEIASANVVQAGQAVEMVWTATLTRNTSDVIQLPSPLEAVDVVASDGDENAYYTIVSAVLKLCERDLACDEYSDAVNVSSSVFSANFTDADTVTFKASDIVIPATGWYSGFVQLTFAGPNPDKLRYDAVTFFKLLATTEDEAEVVASESYAVDGSETYCWSVVADAKEESVAVTSVSSAGSSSDCAYAVNMSVSPTTLIAGSGVQVNWTVAQESSYSGEAVNVTTFDDADTGEYVMLPQVNVYYCNSSTCSLFATDKTLAYSAPSTNLSSVDGQPSFSSPIVYLTEAGTYTFLAHVVIPTGDDFRIDVASFTSVKVSVSTTVASTTQTSSSKLGIILGVTLGCLAVGIFLVFGAMFLGRKQTHEQEPAPVKDHGLSLFDFRPLSNTKELPTTSLNSKRSDESDESGSFMYVKAAKSPLGRARASSLSYDPYTRRSFTEINQENSGYSFVLSESGSMSPNTIAAASEQQLAAVAHRY